MKKINTVLERLGGGVTVVVGTMWCAILFAILSVCATPGVLPAPATAIFTWFTQNFLQLVLLPVIMVGGAVEARKNHIRAKAAEHHAEEMYDWLSELHTSLHGLHSKTDELGKKADAIHENVTGS
jgi:hypothetical protein